MNPLAILSIVLPVIQQLPTIAASIEALVSAVSAMSKAGHSTDAITSALQQSAGDVAQAVVANTPHAAPAA